VSNSNRESSSLRAPDSRIFIDLSLFWEIIEASFVGDLPRKDDAYFGTSLTSILQPPRSEEVIRKQLLPEPTRVSSNVNSSDGHSDPAAAPQQSSLPPAGPATESQSLPPADGSAAILAQDFFALGDDIVGNLDDWWYPQQ
jgi:hypothetical protein